ncbi:interleukin-10 receptor subunit alpha [Pelobates cultripes]|uniref:Interleukin-10 receptor subunit alpha n=1 Tax=Pelobates cultripes TaxID=61616 RepID=A0AAD1WMG1_PELCU|nr:interleukin-10 receptor subunit alpha [Pelobates cultripes]
MADFVFLLLVRAALCLITPVRADSLSAPEDVYYENDFLTWTPADSNIDGNSYEVEYSGYGSGIWKPVPHCSPTLNLTCYLEVKTLPEAEGYYGRVRTISGKQTSKWVQTELKLNSTNSNSKSDEGDILSVPQKVHFELEFFPHLLKWSPPNSTTDNITYEVQYIRYGGLWEPVPHCSPTFDLSCDLTVETLPEALGYYGRVRSVSGNQTSEWVRTNRYTSKDVKLSPPSVDLHVDGSSFIVHLTLPKIEYMNLTQRFEDIFPFSRVYTIHVRRTSDNHTFEQEEDELQFLIPDLAGGHEYCVSVQTSVTSRGNIGKLSKEHCAWLPVNEVDSSVLVIVASSILAIVAFLIFFNIFICFYLRKRVKTPPALKSLIKRSWSWIDRPATPTAEGKISLHWESELTDHLMLEPRNSLLRSSADSGFGSQILTGRCIMPLNGFSKYDREDTDPDTNRSQTTQIMDIPVNRQNSEIHGDDSGISLSTDSPVLKRSCSIRGSIYEKDFESSEDSSKEILENEVSGYLKQPVSKDAPIDVEDKDIQKTWQLSTSDYHKQGSENLYNCHSDFQGHCDDLQGPWTQIPEGFTSTVPLTPAFSPFSRVLLDLGVNPLSLGDVELVDIS